MGSRSNDYIISYEYVALDKFSYSVPTRLDFMAIFPNENMVIGIPWDRARQKRLLHLKHDTNIRNNRNRNFSRYRIFWFIRKSQFLA